MRVLDELEREIERVANDAGRVRPRRRVAGTRFAALVAAVLVAVVLYPRGESADVEVPAASPTASATLSPDAAPRTVEDAYGVFRRPATAADETDVALSGFKGAETRRIAQTSAGNVYLAHKGWGMCLIMKASPGHAGVDSSCGRAADYLDGIILIGAYSIDPGPSTIAFAFPDGVRQVTLTLENGDTSTYAVKTNGFARDVPARPVRLAWTAPNGTAQSLELPHPG
jgi:hypothetical protein